MAVEPVVWNAVGIVEGSLYPSSFSAISPDEGCAWRFRFPSVVLVLDSTDVDFVVAISKDDDPDLIPS